MFSYGLFINDVIYFVLVAAAVFFFVVKPVNAIMARMRKPEELRTRRARPRPRC